MTADLSRAFSFSPARSRAGGRRLHTEKDGDGRVRALAEKAAAEAIRRVTRMLRDDGTGTQDALKAAALVFDKMYRPGGETGTDGPFDIRVE